MTQPTAAYGARRAWPATLVGYFAACRAFAGFVPCPSVQAAGKRSHPCPHWFCRLGAAWGDTPSTKGHDPNKGSHQYYPFPPKHPLSLQNPYINHLASASLVIYAMSVTWVLMRLNFLPLAAGVRQIPHGWPCRSHPEVLRAHIGTSTGTSWLSTPAVSSSSQISSTDRTGALEFPVTCVLGEFCS